MTLTFSFAAPKDVLNKARRDQVELRAAVASQDEQRIGDALLDFAVSVYHVKDWLKGHPGASFRDEDVDDYVAASPALSSFRDLCNAGKHRRISRYIPATSEVRSSANAQSASTLGPEVAPMSVRKTFAIKVVRIDGSRHNAVALAQQAIADWEVFFQDHCL